MSSIRLNRAGAGIAALRRYGRADPRSSEESCELCSVPIGSSHRHLLETSSRRILCACDECATCFQGTKGGRYRLIPRDARALPGLEISDAQWDALALPINLAFFFFHTPLDRIVALYPGPAGAVESQLPLAAWSDLASENPELASMEPDVEALLVNRTGPVASCHIAPIDACFRLVGVFRMHWKGLAGGTDVWREIRGFFDGLVPMSAEGRHA